MKHKKFTIIAGGLLLYTVGAVFFLSTSPNTLPLALLMLPFLYIFVCSYLTMRFLIGRFLAHRPARANILAGLTATGITLLLLLSSLHQLTVRDVLLVVAVAAIFIWYMKKS